MQLEDAKVLSHERLAGEYLFLRLEAPGIAADAAPGQFVHLRVPALEPSALRRPFSICGAEPRTGTLEILYKRVGRGTRAMENLGPGDAVNLMGPLGNVFPMPAENAPPVLVAGGFGVAPLLFLCKRILENDTKIGTFRTRPNAPVLFVGGRTAVDILLLGEFEKNNIETVVCTNDGSLGEKGFVTVALDKHLDGALRDGAVTLYSCGPEPLLEAVDKRAAEHGLTAWLSLDRRMGCAVGACLGCIVKTKTSPDAPPAQLRVCKDGPVFPAGTIIW